eukprot:3389008-Rhodomonas_salina.1
MGGGGRPTLTMTTRSCLGTWTYRRKKGSRHGRGYAVSCSRGKAGGGKTEGCESPTRAQSRQRAR